MRIDRLTVKNFKGLEEREFRFHPEFNLIVGKNGTGKTTLLDALAVAVGGWFLGLRGYDTRHIQAHEVRLMAIRATRKNTTDDRALSWEYQYPCAVTAVGEIQGRPLSWKRTLNTPGGRTTYVDARSIKNLAEESDAAVRAGTPDLILPIVSYYGTGRLWDVPRNRTKLGNGTKHLTSKAKQSRFSGYLNSVDPRVSVTGLVNWFARQSWIAFQLKVDYSPGYMAVRGAIMACIEGATDLYYDAARGEVIVEIEGQGKQPFGNLSDGQRSLLAMVGDLAQKMVALNPQLGKQALKATPGVVLVDELDLHLHPEWQRRLIEDLRTVFPMVQFFASTHSPFLIQSLRSGEELLMLEGSPTAQLANKNPTEIAAGIMGVDHPEVSERYLEMKDSAKTYLEILEKTAKSPKSKLAAFKRELAKAKTTFADNPAFQAFLEMKRASTLGE